MFKNIFNNQKRKEMNEKELSLEKTKVKILEGTLKQINIEFDKSKDDALAKMYFKDFETKINEMLNESYSKIKRLEK